MKRGYIILMMLLLINLFAGHVVLGQLTYIYIDPGHGGPGGSKYGANGDGKGTDGPLPSGKKLSEEWVNLQVSLILKDSIQWYGLSGDLVKMTRTTDTDFVSIDDRIDSANYANCDFIQSFVPVRTLFLFITTDWL
jgi:N-acetylmuramoyl-L-alanine amidase